MNMSSAEIILFLPFQSYISLSYCISQNFQYDMEKEWWEGTCLPCSWFYGKPPSFSPSIISMILAVEFLWMFFIKLRIFPLLLGVFNHEMLGFVNAFLHLLICSCSFSLDVDVVGYVNCFPDKLFNWLCWVLVVVHVVFDLCCSMRDLQLRHKNS